MGVKHMHDPARLLSFRKSIQPRYRVVVVGGGTGLYTALSGLRRLGGVDLAAVVSVMDSGGSSGRLREAFGVLPPGDARQCLVALASDDAQSEMLRDLFTYRFRGGPKAGLDGHNLGNLLLTALTEMTGSAEAAYAWAGRLLAGQGRVIPVSTSSVQLCARLSDGHVVRGEASIDVRTEHAEATIEQVYLDHVAHATESAIESLRLADMVVLGPGDLYTSIIPNLLVEGIVDAIGQARRRVLVVNLMTKPGETDGFRASTFVEKVHEYLAPVRLDAAVINNCPPPPDLVRRYAAQGAAPVVPDVDVIDKLRVQAIARPLASTEFVARHDPASLAGALWNWLVAQTRLAAPGQLTDTGPFINAGRDRRNENRGVSPRATAQPELEVAAEQGGAR